MTNPRSIQKWLGVLLGLALILSSASATAEDVVGATGINLTPTPDGQVSFSVKVETPPGIKGIAPQVSLNYKSGSGNGALGLGGSLSGLSAITRCASTIAQDGYFKGVRLDSGDQFCMGGQRLILINGQHGANGAVYASEIDSFQRIVTNGAIGYPSGGTGPASFTVTNKAGSVIVYGANAESKIADASTGVVYQWLVSYLEDNTGNRIDYSYTDFNANGVHGKLESEKLPLAIHYGGNTSASLNHHLEVRFEYETRPDTSHYFSHGNGFKSTYRLANVKTYADNEMVYDYRLSYDISQASGLSRLTSIQHCTFDGSCKPPSLIDWHTPPQDWTATNTWSIPDTLYDSNGLTKGMITDIDGDGRDDWITAYRDEQGYDHLDSWLNTENGWVNSSAYSPPAPLYINNGSLLKQAIISEITDLNNDGLLDWATAWSQDGTETRKSWINTGSGWQLDSTKALPIVLSDISNPAQSYNIGMVLDINADGRVDMVASTRLPDGSIRKETWVNTGSGWVLDPALLLPDIQFDYASSVPIQSRGSYADLNSDGLIDWFVAITTPSGADIRQSWLNTGSGWVASGAYTLPVSTVRYDVLAGGRLNAEVMDANSDGLADVVQSYQSASGQFISNLWLNTGTGWHAAPALKLPAALYRHSSNQTSAIGNLMDIDGDGLSDLVQAYETESGQQINKVWRYSGTDWIRDSTLNAPGPLIKRQADGSGLPLATFLDANADGVSDYVTAADNYAASVKLYNLANGDYALPESVIQTENGLGYISKAAFKPALYDGLYTKGNDAQYPAVDIAITGALLESTSISDAIGGRQVASHRYAGLKGDSLGRGSLGFSSHTVIDNETGLIVHNTYSQSYPYTGQMITSQRILDGILIGDTTNAYTQIATHGGLSVHPYMNQTITNKREIDGSLIATVTSYAQHDQYGNTITASSQNSDGTTLFSTVASNVFENDTANWVLGKLTTSTQTHSASGTPDIARTSQHTYNLLGQLTRTVSDPGHAQQITSDYSYDSFGNRNQTTVTAADIAARTTSVTFSTDGRFPIQVQNALGHAGSSEYDGRFGVVTLKTDANGQQQRSIYDGFAQLQSKIKLTENVNEESVEGVIKQWCNATCPQHAVFLVGAFDDEGSSPETAYLDMLGRKIRVQTFGLDGRAIYIDTQYDRFGRKARTSRPYYSDEQPVWTQTDYDVIGRPSTITAGNGATNNFTYLGLTTRITNTNQHTTIKRVNATGKPVEIIDPQGNAITYTYNAVGKLLSTTDPHNNIIINEYNQFGQKTRMDDPDMGIWEYQYDSLGQLTWQKDAKGQITTTTFDLVGRPVSRTDAVGTADENTTTWQYDTAANGLGKLGFVSDSGGYQRTHNYDELGRITQLNTEIDGEIYTTENFYRGTTDDVDAVSYPNGMLVRTSYNDYGYPTEVRSSGLIEYQDYLNQLDLVDTLQAEAVALQAELQPPRDLLYSQYQSLINAAKIPEANARAEQAAGMYDLDKYNYYLSKARYYQKQANSINAKINKIYEDAKLAEKLINEWRSMICSRPHNKEDPDLEIKQAAYQKCAAEKSALYDRFLALYNSLPSDSERNNLVAQRDSLYDQAEANAAKANAYAAKATAHFKAASAYMAQANQLYSQASAKAKEINAIDQQLQSAIDSVEAAVEKADELYSLYEGNSVLQWLAQAAAADGQVVKFSQGNGVVTDLTYDIVGRVGTIKAVGSQNADTAFGAEDIANLLDQLSSLIADFSTETVDFQYSLDLATTERDMAAELLAGIQAAIDQYNADGETTLALSLQGDRHGNELELAIKNSEIALYNGMINIYNATIQQAQSLYSEYQNAASIREGRELENAYNEMLAQHYNELESLYIEIAGLQSPNIEAFGLLEPPTAEDLSGLSDLSDQKFIVADLVSIRYETLASESSPSETHPTDNPGWAHYVSAQVLNKRAEVYDTMADVLYEVYDQSNRSNGRISELYTNENLNNIAGFFAARQQQGLIRIDELRSQAQSYRDRALVLEQQGYELEQAPTTQDIASVMADLASAIEVIAVRYLEMSNESYWTALYSGSVTTLENGSALYQSIASEHGLLAQEHQSQAQSAQNAIDHLELVGPNGEIQDEAYLFDQLGNLTYRADYAVDLTEDFQYDELNRLISSQISGYGTEMYEIAALDTTTYEYDALGNITYKSDVGHYTYGENGAGPHAVTSIYGIKNTSYGYDANGNMLSGDGRTITVNSHNKPSFITKDSNTVAFSYGPERQVYKEQAYTDGKTKTTVYAGGLYEKITEAEGITHKYIIRAPGGNTAVVTQKQDDIPTTHYFHRDHLDSIVAISDEYGQVVDRFHYDAFGQRRTAIKTSVTNGILALDQITNRGYTGHIQLAGVGLIHMRGRVYDPGIGRFISADPHIQAPANLQSFNRYSYVLNNPLSLVDPSGYFFSFLKKLIKKIMNMIKKILKVIAAVIKKVVEFVKTYIKLIIVIVIAIYFPPLLANPILNAALVGGVSGFIMTGTLKGALIGAITGAAFAGIGQAFSNASGLASKAKWVTTSFNKFGTKVVTGLTNAGRVVKTLMHGVVGGLRSVASGGKFIAGFASAGLTQAFAPVIDNLQLASSRILAASLVGGTAAELAGGDFKDGAVTGALSRSLNDEAHGHGISKQLTKLGQRIGDWWSSAKDWIAAPKTWMVGAEGTVASGPAGATAEAGVYFSQEGTKIDYGIYKSSGVAYGQEAGVDIGGAAIDASPQDIAGTSYTAGAGYKGSAQAIYNKSGEWVGTRFSYGHGGGVSLTVEQTEFYSLPCSVGLCAY